MVRLTSNGHLKNDFDRLLQKHISLACSLFTHAVTRSANLGIYACMVWLPILVVVCFDPLGKVPDSRPIARTLPPNCLADAMAIRIRASLLGLLSPLGVSGLDYDVLDVRQGHHHVLPAGGLARPVQPLPDRLVQQHREPLPSLAGLTGLGVVDEGDVVALDQQQSTPRLLTVLLTLISTRGSPSEGSSAPGLGTYLRVNSRYPPYEDN